MADLEGFVQAVSAQKGLSSAEASVQCAWYIESTSREPAPLSDVLSFVDEHGLSFSAKKNPKRIRDGVKKIVGVSLDARDVFRFSPTKKSSLSEAFETFLDPPVLTVNEAVLPSSLVASLGTLGSRLAWQINASYQIGAYDGASVLMRRLMEISLIRRFSREGVRSEIVDGKHYLPLDSIIRQVEQTTAFSLTRGSPAAMKQVKTLGDKGAHHTKYSLHRIDIDNAASDFRALMADLE